MGQAEVSRVGQAGQEEIVSHEAVVVNLSCDDETQIAVQLIVYEDSDFGEEKRCMDEVVR